MSRKHTAESSSAALRSPWRKNFTTLAPTVRRAARYALQIVARNPNLHHRFADDDFLGALWSLALPLVDPAKLARLQADWMRPDSESGFADEDGELDLPHLRPSRRAHAGLPGRTFPGDPGQPAGEPGRGRRHAADAPEHRRAGRVRGAG